MCIKEVNCKYKSNSKKSFITAKGLHKAIERLGEDIEQWLDTLDEQDRELANEESATVLNRIIRKHKSERETQQTRQQIRLLNPRAKSYGTPQIQPKTQKVG